MRSLPQNETPRIDWVDYGKGICIILVVMMHSTLGVGAAMGSEGWMHYVVAFAKPFRMPDFFLIAGLFLASRIDKPWRSYLDTKVVHFLYFYWLWVALQFAMKGAPGANSIAEIPLAFLYTGIEPFGTLWFIYILPIFFVVSKLVRRVPVPIIFAVAAGLEMAPIHTGWLLIDEFAARYVYFFAGWVFAPVIFRLAAAAQRDPALALTALLAWALTNLNAVWGGYSELPGVSLILGLAGAGAIIAIAALLARIAIVPSLAYLGEHSIVVYLAFFLPMAVSREIILASGLMSDVGHISLFVTASGVIAPLIFHMLVRNTPLSFLFERPCWAKLEPHRSECLKAAA